MKEARAIWRARAVREVSYEDGLLSGRVRGANKGGFTKAFIRSVSDVDNQCQCYPAKKMGVICAHVVAVGLEYLDPQSGDEVSDAPEKKEESLTAVSSDWPRWTVEEDAEAMAVRLEVLLPVQLEKAWAANQLMVGVEVESLAVGERQMLRALAGHTLFVSEADAAILECLQSLSPTEVPGIGFLSKEAFLELLSSLGGHPRVKLGKRDVVEVSVRQARLPLVVEGGRVGASAPEGFLMIHDGQGWFFNEKKGRLSPVGLGLAESLTPIWTTGISLLEAGRYRALLESLFVVSDEIAEVFPIVVQPLVRVILEGSLNHLEAFVRFDYDIRANGKEFIRDEESEREVTSFWSQWEFEEGRKAEEGEQKWLLKDKESIVRFHAYGRVLVPSEWEVEEGERFQHATTQVVEVKPEWEVTSQSEDWFEVNVAYRTQTGKGLSAAEVRKIFMGQAGGQRQLPDGRVAVMAEDRAAEVEELQRDLEGQQVGGGKMRVPLQQQGFLRETVKAGLLKISGLIENDEEWEWDLGPAEDLLRSYQRHGVDWMLQLASAGLGGILADDMGLGKTLQTLTFLYATGGQSLVVCPSSLVSNWVAEAGKFFPEMKVLALEGPQRHKRLKKEGEDADMLVTSYALLRQDLETWREWGFTTIVLDEAQTIKNPEAQVSRAAYSLSGENRFALTGTPIENSVKDLWSILNFAQPGYLGKRQDFVERYEKPLAKGGSPELQERLARRLRPLLLRRLKTEVATELPAKIEQVRRVSLTKRQREVYEGILRESRERVAQAEGGAKRMVALTSLLRLRQACCDLRLLGLDSESEGAKVAVLRELLSEAIEGGHRILIFSQFVKFLQALIPMLAEEKWSYCYLDGSTKDRGSVVKRFQENEDIPIFLISLKAGGVGLNLTGADTVIHVDPWWNPAVEAQATDRAYRIGQTRVVTSYKLISENTVEEKILTLQEKKKELMEATMGGDGGGSGLSQSEILDILEG